MDGVTLGGTTYNVHVVPDSVKRIAELMEGVAAGDMISGRHERDLKGTSYSYALQVEPVWTDPAAYDAFYDAVTAPVDAQYVVLPYGQTTIGFNAMIKTVEDGLIGEALGVNRWHGLTVRFIPQSPQREAT